MTKTCRICNEEKTVDNFYRHPLTSDGLYHECKVCKGAYQKARADRNRQYVMAVLTSSSGCADCGTQDLRVLEFDHVRGNKSANVGDLMAKGSPISKLQEEIDKCEIVCANCHKIRTYTRRGDTYRDRIS